MPIDHEVFPSAAISAARTATSAPRVQVWRHNDSDALMRALQPLPATVWIETMTLYDRREDRCTHCGAPRASGAEVTS